MTGYYTEIQPTRESGGEFTFELLEDRMRLSGNMWPTSGEPGSDFTGFNKELALLPNHAALNWE